MNLTLLAFACARDREMIEPFLAMAARAYPGASILIANDGADPADLPAGIRSFDSRYSELGQVASVPAAIARAATLTPASDWIIKSDIDIAHISARWLSPANRSARLVGFQNRDHPWAFWGWAYAMDREMAAALAKGCPLPTSYIREEDYYASVVCRWHAPNGIVLHRHDPLGKGIAATWNPAGCRHAPTYRARYAIVHTAPRSATRAASAAVMMDIADLQALRTCGLMIAD